MIELYHFTNSQISQFQHVRAIRGYSRATKNGIYFTTDYNKGMIKYGRTAKYCYKAVFTGDSIINLGEFDSMYIDGTMIHSCSLVAENFRREIAGLQTLKEPDILLEHISNRAFTWLKSNGVQAICGMYSDGYACPEFCVIDETQLEIVDVIKLH